MTIAGHQFHLINNITIKKLRNDLPAYKANVRSSISDVIKGEGKGVSLKADFLTMLDENLRNLYQSLVMCFTLHPVIQKIGDTYR